MSLNAPAARAIYRIRIWSGRTSGRGARATTTSKPWSVRSRSREWRAEGARIKPDAPDRVRLRQFRGVAFANRLRDGSAQPGASGGESFHPFDIAVPGSPIVIAIGIAARESQLDEVCADFIGHDTGIAAEVSIGAHQEIALVSPSTAQCA